MRGSEPNFGRHVAEAILNNVHKLRTSLEDGRGETDAGREADRFWQGRLCIDDRGIWVDLPPSPCTGLEREVFEWHPLHEVPEEPDASAKPSLPFPFTPSQLAAFLIDGTGALVAAHYGEWEDGPDSEALATLTGVAAPAARTALTLAFAAFRDAQAAVGRPLDLALLQRAESLRRQFREAERLANEREQVSASDISAEERGARRTRARESLTDLELRLQESSRIAQAEMARWRRAVVQRLLRKLPLPARTAGATRRVDMSRGQLDGVFALAERAATDPMNWQTVWQALVDLAGSATPPNPLDQYDTSSQEVVWRDAQEMLRRLKREDFRQRWKRREKRSAEKTRSQR